MIVPVAELLKKENGSGGRSKKDPSEEALVAGVWSAHKGGEEEDLDAGRQQECRLSEFHVCYAILHRIKCLQGRYTPEQGKIGRI